MVVAAMRKLCIVGALALLAACGRIIPQGEIPPAPQANALLAGVRAGPAIGSLQLRQDDAGAALASFAESCPRLLRREDVSGLTMQADWRSACDAALAGRVDSAAGFFAEHFETAVVGDGKAFATGYFEPEIAGVRTRQPGFDVPVYALPPDLVRGWPDDIPPAERTGREPLGRYDEGGKFVYYFDRTEIENGALAGRELEIAWAADPIEFFFLQIQGSGRLKAPDGSVIRIGYAGQNGREYLGVGAEMRRRGLLGDGPGQYEASMQGIMH